MKPRYTIYFVPAPKTPLYRFGASLLGYDCHSGRAVPFPSGVPGDWLEIVREPRLYGFHATLKAPFRLAQGVTEADLLGAARRFAEDRPTVNGGRLAVRALGAFIALVPTLPCEDIDRLAAHAVRDLDCFRAPLSTEERARRLIAPLTAAQIERLDRWGYPYVFDDFRFHMTLTGALEVARREELLEFLQTKFEQEPAPHRLLIDQIVVARQDGKGASFQVIATAALGQSAHRPFAYTC